MDVCDWPKERFAGEDRFRSMVGETAREDTIPSDKAPGAERFHRFDFMTPFQLDPRDVCHNSSECSDHDYIAPTMSQNKEASWFMRIVGYVASLSPEQSTPRTAKAQGRDAWLRTDAYLLCENQDFESLDPQHQANALRRLNDCVQVKQNQDANFNFNQKAAYPNLEAANRILQQEDGLGGRPMNAAISLSKRKRDQDPLLEEFQNMDTLTKKRRIIARDSPDAVDDGNAPEADFAIRARKQSMSLYQGLRTHWTCVCQKCSRLSVRLSLPPPSKSSPLETSFEVFFGVKSLLQVSLQEAKITIKDEAADLHGHKSEITSNQQTCLHLKFENGMFKRLRPQPKVFGDPHHPQMVSLSALFKRQQELTGGTSVLPHRGKRILAVVLATALLPFLETPWVQPTFNHSNIQFFQPLEEDSLPDITKPFLDMKRVPVAMPNREMAREHEAEMETAKHMVHPNASVLALGILLCELHYCKPIEAWQDDPDASQTVNSAYYTSLEVLKDLEVDAGMDYYLATKACLQWEYLPAGEYTTFESASVQKLFYQNVVKRLESEILNTWLKGLENLQSLSAQENKRCWGRNGCEVIRQHTARRESVTRAASEPSVILPSPDLQTTARRYSTVPTPGLPRYYIPLEASQSLQFFDANHQMASEQGKPLSDRWMGKITTSIYQYIDDYEKVMPSGRTQLAAFGVDGPVRIAILDSGFDTEHPLFKTGEGKFDPRLKGFRNFVAGQNEEEHQDEIGHGTHALGLLLKVATCAEIYIARIANQATLGRDSYRPISKAINHAVSVWKVDVISMSFGIREFDEELRNAIGYAREKNTLMFAAASNDGLNHGRAFPAKDSRVFCIHSSNGLGVPSGFNPMAEEDDVNLCLLGEDVESYWPVSMNAQYQGIRVMSGTSVATPIAAGIAASLLSFVRQQEQDSPTDNNRLGKSLKDFDTMKAVLKSTTQGRGRDDYDYILPDFLSNMGSSKEEIYFRIKYIRDHM
ncbi:intracellular serine protease [Fusarium mexicanum]|uniref:Intracellular serine protease n=1 Tax=Fusarium mexicanum TaxID=751941 RepID=A0A8H5MK68_9HYPO|nr:intracellular serine protease [Fusarium mexicanum]